MKNFLKEIMTLWWVEAGVALKDPKSEASIKALKTILREDLELDDDFIDYIVESVTNSPTNFIPKGNIDSGTKVNKTQTSVSAQIASWSDDEEITEDEEVEEIEGEEPDEEIDDKDDAVKDIKLNGLTDYEKDKLKENILIELGAILSEASVYSDDYGLGHKVMWSSSGQKSFAARIEDGAPMMTMPATKVKPTADAIQVGDDTGIEVYLKGANGKVYHIKGKGTSVGNMFKHYKDNTSFKLDTGDKETAALLGVYINAEKFLSDFNNATDETLPKLVTTFKNTVTSTLTGQDWASNDIVSMLSKASIVNIIQVCAIAAGMDRFCKIKGTKGWSIIHGRIEDYYTAESKNPHTKAEGSKKNTADCVIVKGSVASFIENLKTEKISYDSNGLCTLTSGEKFFQISLKQAEGEAQLGKITSDFAKKFGMMSNDDLANMFIHEGVQLDEGLKDLFDKGLKFVKSVGKAIIDKISQMSTMFGSFFKANLKALQSAKKKSEKKTDDFIMNLSVDKKYLDESLILEKKGKISIEDKVEAIAQDADAFGKLYTYTSNKFLLVLKKTKKPGLKSVGNTVIPKASKPSADIVRKLMANAKAYDSIERILSGASGQQKEVDQLFKDMLTLEKEMYFGRTSLPLVKVYGLKPNGGGTAWTFLKTGKEFVEERISAFSDMPENVLIVNSAAQADGYMAVSTLMLSHLNKKTQSPMYNMVTFRTNSKTSTTFVIEGSKVVNMNYIRKNIL